MFKVPTRAFRHSPHSISSLICPRKLSVPPAHCCWRPHHICLPCERVNRARTAFLLSYHHRGMPETVASKCTIITWTTRSFWWAAAWQQITSTGLAAPKKNHCFLEEIFNNYWHVTKHWDRFSGKRTLPSAPPLRNFDPSIEYLRAFTKFLWS